MLKLGLVKENKYSFTKIQSLRQKYIAIKIKKFYVNKHVSVTYFPITAICCFNQSHENELKPSSLIHGYLTKSSSPDAESTFTVFEQHQLILRA
jgi:hypothetical protein